jgi:hypothetical protein
MKSSWPIVALILLGIALKIFLVLQPAGFLVTNLISDDAFYYFLIAKNVISGVGTSVDGVNLTNGFHPLWLVILLPIFKLFGSGMTPDMAPIYATLGLSVILDGLVAFVIFRIVSRYTMNVWLKFTSVAVWLFNPFNVYEMLGGLETSISIFFISLLVLLGIKLRESPRAYLYILSGIVGGLMMLARLDNIFYFIFFLLWIFFTHGEKRLNRTVLVGVLASLVVLPWLIWNISVFGMLVPASGASSTMVNHALVVQDNGPGIIQTLKATVFFSYLGLSQVIQQTGMPILFLVILGLILGGWIFDRHLMTPGTVIRWPAELFLFFGFIVHFFLSASIRWTFRSWYFIPFNFFLSLLIAWFFARVAVKINYKKPAVILFLALFTFSSFISWSRNLEDSQIQQSETMAVAEWTNSNLPRGTVIGAFNSGVLGYFSNHRVINLDGLVNNKAFAALRDKKLFDYIEEEKIDYLIDFEIYPTYRYRGFLGVDDPLSRLTVAKNIKVDDSNRSRSGINVYKIIQGT